MTDRTYGEAFAERLQEVADQAYEVQAAIGERLIPVVMRAAYDMHVWYMEMQPWWRVWWHTMTGHRR